MSGYTRVENWLFDVVMPTVKPNAFKIIMAIVRKTSGWGKQADIISLSEMQKITGIGSRVTVCAAIEDAISSGYIARAERGGSYEYRILTSTETVLPQYRNCTSTSTETVLAGSTVSVHTKEKEKESIKDPVKSLAEYFQNKTALFYDLSAYEREWEPALALWWEHYGDGTRDMIDRAIAFARGENEQGRRYTIKSPASLSAIMSNLKSDGRKNGVLMVEYR